MGEQMSGHIKESRSKKASTSGEADDTNVAERGLREEARGLQHPPGTGRGARRFLI